MEPPMKPSILTISKCRPIAFRPTGQYFTVLLGALGAWAVASAAGFNPPIVIESPAPEFEGHFGLPSSVPDVNGDGHAEILISDVHSAYLYDGITRQLLREFSGSGGFGIGDVNGDGRGDVVTLGAADVNVYDGSTG